MTGTEIGYIANVVTAAIVLTSAWGVYLQYMLTKARERDARCKRATMELVSSEPLLKLAAITTLANLARAHPKHYQSTVTTVLKEFLVAESKETRTKMEGGTDAYLSYRDNEGDAVRTTTAFKTAFMALGQLRPTNRFTGSPRRWLRGQGARRNSLTFGYVGIHRGTISGGNFSDCDFVHFRIDELVFADCVFIRCTFRNLRILRHVLFYDCILEDCSFEVVDFDTKSMALDSAGKEKLILSNGRNRCKNISINKG